MESLLSIKVFLRRFWCATTLYINAILEADLRFDNIIITDVGHVWSKNALKISGSDSICIVCIYFLDAVYFFRTNLFVPASARKKILHIIMHYRIWLLYFSNV